MTDLSNVHDIDDAVTHNIGEGRTYKTLDEEPIEFRAVFEHGKDLILIYLPGRATGKTTIRAPERIAVWRKWLDGQSFDPADYQDVGKNHGYLLAVLKAVSS